MVEISVFESEQVQGVLKVLAVLLSIVGYILIMVMVFQWLVR